MKIAREYKCYDCGAEFDEYEEVSESRGEFWGMPAYETMAYCPICHSENFFDDAEHFDWEEFRRWQGIDEEEEED